MANNFNSLINITFQDQSDIAQDIGKVTSFGGVSMTAADTDVTTFDSTWKEFCAGMPDGGVITLGMVRDYDNVGQAAFKAAIAARSTKEMVITFSVGTVNTITLSGHVNSFEDDGTDMDGVLLGTVALKISGEPVYTAV